MAQYILYGIAGASKQYVAVRYEIIEGDWASVWSFRHIANTMRMEYPTVEHVYLMDNRYGLRREFTESIKQHSIESCAIFKDTLEREGIKLI